MEHLMEIVETLFPHHYLLDRSFRFCSANDAALADWGRTRDDVIGKTFDEVFPDPMGRRLDLLHQQALNERKVIEAHTLSPAGDGTWKEVVLYPTAQGLGAYFRDITNANMAQNIGKHFRALFERAPGLYLVLIPDDEFHIVAASDAYLRATMTERQSIIGRPLFEVFPDDPHDPMADGVRKLRASLQAVKRERRMDIMPVQRYAIRRPESQGDGFEERWWSPVNSPVFDDDDNRVLYIIHRVEDVTDFIQHIQDHHEQLDDFRQLEGPAQHVKAELVLRAQELKRAADQCRASAERLQFAIRSVNTVVWEWAPPSARLYTTTNMQEVYGANSLATIEQLCALIHPEDRERYRSLLDTVAAHGEGHHHKFRIIRPDTRTIAWIEERASAVLDETGQIVRIIGVAAEITERKRFEEQLRESEQEFGWTFELSPVAKVHVDAISRRFLRVNDRFCQLTGYDRGQLLMMRSMDLLYPDDRHLDEMCWGDLLRTNGQHSSHEMRYVTQTGETVWVQVLAGAVRDSAGKVTRLVAEIADITGQKKAEEAVIRSQQQLEQAVIERTQQSVRLQQRVRAVATGLTLAEERDRRRLANEVRDSFSQLLAFVMIKVRQAAGMIPQVQPYELLQEATASLKESLALTRTLTVELSPLVLQDFSLVPALRWLAKHMETRGLHVDLQIETDSVVVPDDHSVLLFRSVHGLLCNVVNHAGTDRAMLSVLQHAGELRITIRDQGAGFEPAAVLAEETAVPAGRRALGLFSIRERMQLIEGRCEVSSSPGAGTCVVLAVPITDSVVDHLNPTPANQVTGRRDPQCIRIVLVDDHPLMREGLRSILSINPRFEVVGEGGDGFEALELARALSPDVMLMDINMPKMDGIKATKRLTEEFPSITVVGLSVHHSPSIIERMKEAGASAFLMKETLSYTVGDEIERARKQKRTNQ